MEYLITSIFSRLGWLVPYFLSMIASFSLVFSTSVVLCGTLPIFVLFWFSNTLAGSWWWLMIGSLQIALMCKIDGSFQPVCRRWCIDEYLLLLNVFWNQPHEEESFDTECNKQSIHMAHCIPPFSSPHKENVTSCLYIVSSPARN